jgi:hypothetical protein
LGEDVELSDGGSEFQLTVGDCAAGHEAFGDTGGPVATPENWQDLSIMKWNKLDPTESEARSITSTVSGRGSVRNNLLNLHRARTHIFNK